MRLLTVGLSPMSGRSTSFYHVVSLEMIFAQYRLACRLPTILKLKLMVPFLVSLRAVTLRVMLNPAVQ